MVASLDKLPEELVLMTTSHLAKDEDGSRETSGRESILTLARVCRRLSEVILPLIYGRVLIKKCRNIEDTLLRFAWTIMTNPARGRLVHEFECRVNGESVLMDDAFRQMRIDVVKKNRQASATNPDAFHNALAAALGDDRHEHKDGATGKQVIRTWSLREYNGLPDRTEAQDDAIRARLKETFPDPHGYKLWEQNILRRQYFTAIIVFTVMHLVNLRTLRIRPDDNDFWEVMKVFVDALNRKDCQSSLKSPLQDIQHGYLVARRWRERRPTIDLSPLSLFTGLPNFSELTITRLRIDDGDESSRAARAYLSQMPARASDVSKLSLVGASKLLPPEMKQFLAFFRRLTSFSYDTDMSFPAVVQRPAAVGQASAAVGQASAPSQVPLQSLSPGFGEAIAQHAASLENLALVANAQRGQGFVPEHLFTKMSFKGYDYLKRLVISPEFLIINSKGSYVDPSTALVEALPTSLRDLVISTPTSLRMSKRVYVRYMEKAVEALLQAKAHGFMFLRRIAIDLTYRLDSQNQQSMDTTGESEPGGFTIDEYDTLFHAAEALSTQHGVDMHWDKFNKKWDDSLELFVYAT